MKQLFQKLSLSLLALGVAPLYGTADAATDLLPLAAGFDSLAAGGDAGAPAEAADVKAGAAATAARKEETYAANAITAQVAAALPSMPKELRALIYHYTRPAPISFKNNLQGKPLGLDMKWVRVLFSGIDTTLVQGADWPADLELEWWQIAANVEGGAVGYTLVYYDPFRRNTVVKHYSIDVATLEKGRTFTVSNDKRGEVFVGQSLPGQPAGAPERLVHAKPKGAAGVRSQPAGKVRRGLFQ